MEVPVGTGAISEKDAAAYREKHGLNVAAPAEAEPAEAKPEDEKPVEEAAQRPGAARAPCRRRRDRAGVLRVRPSAVMGTRVIHTRTSAVIHPLIAHPSLCATHKALATGAGTQEALAIVRAPHRPSQSLHVCDRFDSTDAESNHELCSHLPPQFRPPPPWPSHHPKTLKSFIKIY